jgi:UDP-N-acetylmuramate--alanine ligase
VRFHERGNQHDVCSRAKRPPGHEAGRAASADAVADGARAAARAAAGARGPLWAVFQPHTRNRTARLLDEFAAAFGAADAVVITAIYEPLGREREPLDVSGADLAARIVGPPATYAPDLEAAADYLAARVPPGTLVLTMGAGDVDRLGPILLEKLRARHE